MTSNPAHRAPAGTIVPSVADAAADLAAALDALGAAERATCRAVLALSRTVGTGIVESLEGLPPDLLLANLCRLIQADRSTILTAADVLRSMPATADLWRAGRVSWGQVRNICRKASRIPTDQRETLDRRIAATVDTVDAYGPDGLLDAVDRAIDDLRDPDEIERQQTYERTADFLSMQGRLDGGLRLYGEFAPGVDAAIIANGLTTAAPPLVADGSTRGERLATGLKRICAGWLAGDTGRRAKPLVNVLVDLAQVTVNAAGTVDLHVDGPLTTLTARTVEALAEDADLRVTLFDGARPLATSKKRTAEDVPADVRRAVAFRDRGDRMPGSRAPTAWTDVHHVRQRSKGGDHSPDNVVRLRSRWHQLLHRRGWANHLDPGTGIFTIHRDGRTYRSLPKGTPLRADPGPDPPGEPPGDPPTDELGSPIPF